MSDLTKMIYIASPYSGKHWCWLVNWFTRLRRYKQVTALTGKLQDKYQYSFIGPITQSHNTAKYMKSNSTDFKAWRKRDLTYISRCDEVWVVMMEGWDQSIGVLAEIEFAKTIYKMKVKYIDPITLKFKRRK